MPHGIYQNKNIDNTWKAIQGFNYPENVCYLIPLSCRLDFQSKMDKIYYMRRGGNMLEFLYEACTIISKYCVYLGYRKACEGAMLTFKDTFIYGI